MVLPREKSMSMKQMAVDGVEIAYLDQGEGPIVIAAHCSSASHKEWLPLIDRLSSEWRVLAPDLIGYGRSGAWPEDKVFTARPISRCYASSSRRWTSRCI